MVAQEPLPAAQMALFPEMNPGPVIRTDTDGVITFVNAAARALFDPVKPLGQAWLEVCRDADRAVWSRALAGEDCVQHEAKIGERVFTFTYRRPPSIASIFIYGNDVTRLRSTEDALRQSEKLALLGTLAAGVAHELNNPATAATRGAGHLRDAFSRMQDAFAPLLEARFSGEQAKALLEMAKEDRERFTRIALIDPLTRSDTESAVEEWLEDHNVEDPWELAPALVSLGYDTHELEQLAAQWTDSFPAVAAWIGRAQPILALVREVEEATRRISEIVKAVKSYSFLGQAPVRPMDVIEGIDNTLVIMRNQLKEGVRVDRQYEPDLPAIESYGTELNQVWTNLIDNAVYAMDGHGTLTIRARREDSGVVVEIEDTGKGMPESVRQRIFDPFFTTKGPGKGTGLGLSTSHNIVVKQHGGTIDVSSRPGQTIFRIRLPFTLGKTAASTPNDTGFPLSRE